MTNKEYIKLVEKYFWLNGKIDDLKTSRPLLDQTDKYLRDLYYISKYVKDFRIQNIVNKLINKHTYVVLEEDMSMSLYAYPTLKIKAMPITQWESNFLNKVSMPIMLSCPDLEEKKISKKLFLKNYKKQCLKKDTIQELKELI